MDVIDTNLLLSQESINAMCGGFASNMLWLDMEFTDLHRPENGKVLEIGARITTNSMRHIPEAVCHVVIRHESLVPDDLNHFCREHFTEPRPADGNASLVELCNRSEISLKDAEALLVDLVDVYRGNQQIQLCGATVRKDLQYIELYMPALYQRIHYQLRDATSQLSDAIREFPAIRSFLPTRSRSHCAMDDIDETLRLSRWLSAITKRDFLQLPTGQILMRDGPTIDEVMTLDVVVQARPPATLRVGPAGLRPFSASHTKKAPPVIFPMPHGGGADGSADQSSPSTTTTRSETDRKSVQSSGARHAPPPRAAAPHPHVFHTPRGDVGGAHNFFPYQSTTTSPASSTPGPAPSVSGSAWRKWPPRMAAASLLASSGGGGRPTAMHPRTLR